MILRKQSKKVDYQDKYKDYNSKSSLEKLKYNKLSINLDNFNKEREKKEVIKNNNEKNIIKK